MPDHNQEINGGESVNFVLITTEECTRGWQVSTRTRENESADTCG